MAAGVDAVKAEIVDEFNTLDIMDRYDTDLMSTVISFKHDGCIFKVIVANEFENAYPSGPHVDLTQLGRVIRASKSGQAVVRTTGISAG